MCQVSVIIPNTNSPLIRQIVAQLKTQIGALENARIEILIVGSGTPPDLQQEAQVQVLDTTGQTTFASDKRNLGIQAARGKILCFLDDDCLPAPHWLGSHLQQHARGKQVVGGAVTFRRRPYLQLADNVSAFHDLLPFTAVGPRPYLCTANLSVARDVIEQVGLLPPRRNRAEDLEWTVRMRQHGLELYFAPEARVQHDPPRRTIQQIWHHWVVDAPDTLAVRLAYAKLLKTPKLACYRAAYICGAPLIAAWATLRTFRHHQTRRQYWHTFPVVYLTKLAWCGSAYQHFPA